MRKHLFLLAAGALALNACTSEDVVNDVESSRNSIQFENVVNKLTRAGDLTTSNLSKFNVFGFYTLPDNQTVANEVFEDVTVTRQDDGKWTYSGDDRSWIPNGKYYFYAYSCGNVTKLDSKFGSFKLNMNSGLTAAERVLIIENFLCDNTHQHDLIYASNTGATETDKFAGILGKESGNDPVGLQFKHILSKVKARFSSKFPSEYEIVIRNVKIVNLRNIGTYNPFGGWQNVNRKTGEQPFVYLLNTGDASVNPISVKNEKDERGNQAVAESSTAYVLPYAYSGVDGTPTEKDTWVYLNFEIDIYLGTNKVMSKILTGKFNPIWQEGYSYIYNVELSGSAAGLDVITFTTATDADGNVVTKWNEDETPSIAIN